MCQVLVNAAELRGEQSLEEVGGWEGPRKASGAVRGSGQEQWVQRPQGTYGQGGEKLVSQMEQLGQWVGGPLWGLSRAGCDVTV